MRALVFFFLLTQSAWAVPMYSANYQKYFVALYGSFLATSPSAFNTHITQRNAAFLPSGAKDHEHPQVSSHMSGEIFLGYGLYERWDLGLHIVLPIKNNDSRTGSQTGGTLVRTHDLAFFGAMLRGNYYFTETSYFQFYLSPAAGWGSVTYIFFDGGTTRDEATTRAGGFLGQGLVGMSWNLASWLDLTLEGGYRFASSGELEVISANQNVGQAEGATFKFENGSAGKIDLSGFVLAFGVQARF